MKATLTWIVRSVAVLGVVGAVAWQAVQSARAETEERQVAQAPQASLTDTYWKLVEVDGLSVTVAPEMREPHIVLASQENRVRAFAGCNLIGGGNYQVDGDGLRFGPVITTKMYCARGMEVETAFLNALTATDHYRISGEQLELLTGDQSVAKLVAVYSR